MARLAVVDWQGTAVNKFSRILCWVVVAVWAVACGGGGGEPGTSVFSSKGSGGSAADADSSTSSPDASEAVGQYAISLDLQRSGSSITQFSSTETVQAKARLVNTAGAGVEGVILTFGESGASLLKFAPDSKTALTDAQGYASIDVAATDPTKVGAVAVVVSGTVSGTSLSAQKALTVSAGTQVPGEVAVPRAINYVRTEPADRSIVIKNAGGTGRSESATLVFKIVDSANTPIKGAQVNFSVESQKAVTLNITSSTSDADGLVKTTISSGTEPTTVVVKAVAQADSSVTSVSDTLTVSNGQALAGGFEIVAKKYNLDGRLTGDAVEVTAFVVDEFGNPVPEGVAVSFTTDRGSIGASTRGGCVTNSVGQCTVEFRVQEPRGDGIATVIGSAEGKDGITLSDSIRINMAGVSSVFMAKTVSTGDAVGAVPSSLTLMGECKAKMELYLTDGSTANRAVTSGTTIAPSFTTQGVKISISGGSPVLDSPSLFPTQFAIDIDLTGIESVGQVCDVAGTLGASNQFFRLQYKTPAGNTYTQRFDLIYPH